MYVKRILATVCVLFFLPVIAACSNKESGTQYKMTLEYFPEEQKLTGDMTISYENTTEEELTELWFNLPANAYREGATYAPISPAYNAAAYDGKINYGGMRIKAVDECAGWEVGGEDENLLVVSLKESLFPDETATLHISFETTLAQVNHRLGVTERCVNLGNFYPILCAYDNGFYPCVYYSDGDPFYSECASYEVTLTVPSTYQAATSGEIISTSSANGKTQYCTRLENARDYAAVLSEEFKVLQEEASGTTLFYYYIEDESASAHMAAIKESFTYFSNTFGAYPYTTFSTVQTGFCYGGMEYPALTMLNEKATESNYLYALVHETAHQWWYAAVGNNQVEHAWMDEGLAEYSALLFFEQAPAYGFTREGLVSSAQKAYRSFVSVYEQIFGESDTSMNRHLKSYLSDYEYSNIAYNKGLLLFENLRQSLGDDRFFAGLRSYYKQYTGKIAKPEDMIGCFERTGVDVEGYFKSFLEGNAVI